MATVAQDTFTESHNKKLSQHTPDVGTGWTTDLTSEWNMTVIAASDHVDCASAVDAGFGAREDTDVGDDDMDVSLTISADVPSFGVQCGAAGRIPSGAFDGDNAYAIEISSSQYELFKRVGGTPTSLGSWGTAPAVGDTQKLEIRAATKKVFVNGTERISSTDDSLTGNSYAGILTPSGNPVDNVTYDDFLSESVAAAAVSDPPFKALGVKPLLVR